MGYEKRARLNRNAQSFRKQDYSESKDWGNTDILNSIPIPIAISIRYSPSCISLDPSFGALCSNQIGEEPIFQPYYGNSYFFLT